MPKHSRTKLSFEPIAALLNFSRTNFTNCGEPNPAVLYSLIFLGLQCSCPPHKHSQNISQNSTVPVAGMWVY